MTRKAAFFQLHTRLTPEQLEWVKSEGRRLRRSQADIVRLCVDRMMKTQTRIGDEPTVDGLLDELLFNPYNMEHRHVK